MIATSTSTRFSFCHAFVHPLVRSKRMNGVARNQFKKAINPTSQIEPFNHVALNLKFIESSDDDGPPTKYQLTEEQDKALRNAVGSLEDRYGIAWPEKDAAWDTLREENPVMNALTDNDLLRRTYYQQEPDPLDLFTKTPLGPFILINLLFLATGFSWCDTPFHADGACPPL